ncbi:MAG: hypothetical protein GWP91_01210 [Rhodobacterales bacterium]|nr:hypothetical protein [Rhodobacterales bacterium]
MPPCKSIYGSVFLAFVAASAHAADPSYSADLLGQGQAGIAASANNLALLSNPGLVALDERYEFGVSGQLGGYGATQIAVSAVDAKTAKNLALGVSYIGDKSEVEPTVNLLPGWLIPGETIANIRREHNFALILGTNALNNAVSFGLGGAFSLYAHDLEGRGMTGNLDAGMGAHLTRWLILGATGRNLIPIDNAGAMPLTGGMGLKFHSDRTSLLMDGSWQDEAKVPWIAGGGIEQAVGEYPKVRLGYRYDGPTRRQDLTGGFGVRSPEGGFDLGIAVPVDGRTDIFNGVIWSASLTFEAPDLGDPSR